VAKLAGLPREVLAEARRYLTTLESQATRSTPGPQGNLPLDPPADAATTPPINSEARDELDAVRTALAALDPDSLTPRDALGKLYEIKKLLAD
jgi:DNA mismatch repair protein MutS